MEEADNILFEIDDYLLFDAELEEQQAMQRPFFLQNSVDASGSTTGVEGRGESLQGKRSSRVAFITQSENENLVDGYKWRKYGKKMVKGNPNPRNYFRCTIEGCCVKKRVERMKEDSSYVITTYEGRHNHMAPSELAQHGAAHFLPLN
ncbi:hypothetical protein HPP92_009123 [Vanilla planifolia]|uniref:WRKY domain-containing protein n=1 Tax=Vanilla planifolia TaxID=51239 RepID=A0A835R5Z3_VANPL|nr:hypothetical protein HPP92_009123 [Vanilla planifolia]